MAANKFTLKGSGVEVDYTIGAPHRPSTWRCIEMSGTAESVIVPL
jgi:hypothetical protein